METILASMPFSIWKCLLIENISVSRHVTENAVNAETVVFYIYKTLLTDFMSLESLVLNLKVFLNYKHNFSTLVHYLPRIDWLKWCKQTASVGCSSDALIIFTWVCWHGIGVLCFMSVFDFWLYCSCWDLRGTDKNHGILVWTFCENWCMLVQTFFSSKL